jgi:hypothetical protein
LRVHAASDLFLKDNSIAPAKWWPLIYNFRRYFRLADRELGKTFRAEASDANSASQVFGKLLWLRCAWA